MDIEIPLPKGCIEGNKICIRGKGDEYPNMESGDLIFTIKYKPHSFYYTVESEIGDLFCNIDITLYEFLYGFSRVIPFLNGEYIKIVQPANTSMSNIISKPIIKVIRNKGLTFKNHVGDLNLIFQINIPLLKESQNKVFHDLLKTSKYNNCQPLVSEDTSFCETYNLQNL